MGILVLISQGIKVIGLTGAFGAAVKTIIDLFIFIATMILGIIAGVWFVLQGAKIMNFVLKTRNFASTSHKTRNCESKTRSFV